jgi:peptide/nickel transport system substrate-binding protein
MSSSARRLVLAVAVACLGTPAWAQTLTMGISAAPASVDPHFSYGTSGQTLSSQLFDTLFDLTPEVTLAPALATSWKPISERVWEIKLRPDVKFSDGTTLSADDVAFTIARAPKVPNAPSSYAGAVRSIARVEVVDALTLHLHTPTPSPTLPIELQPLAIVSRHAGEGATTEDYNSGKAAIGTGPYKLVSFRPGDQAELVRNDSWWGPRPAWEHVVMKYMPNGGTRSAALLSGGVDLIDAPAPNDLETFRADQRLTIASLPGMRMVYVAPNQGAAVPAGITANDGKPLERNPLADVRVRQALSHAINRQALVDRVMLGTATPTGQFLPPGTFSYNNDVPVPSFDPDLAKRLLTEAGYPNGFRIAFPVAQNVRPTDPVAVQAIAQMWTRIGVQTSVEIMPLAPYMARGAKLDFAISYWGWGSPGHAGHPLVNVLGTDDRAKLTGSFNRQGNATPALDALTARALQTLDDGQRETLLRQAVAIAAEQAIVIPVYQLTNYWVTRKGVAYTATGYDYTRAVNARAAP